MREFGTPAEEAESYRRWPLVAGGIAAGVVIGVGLSLGAGAWLKSGTAHNILSSPATMLRPAIREAEQDIKAHLVDPDSAQFRNERVGAGGAICGEVNAKNRMGGYVGFGPYVHYAKGITLVTNDAPDFESYFRLSSLGFNKDAFDRIEAACATVAAWHSVCGGDYFGADVTQNCLLWEKGGKSMDELRVKFAF